MAVSPKSDPVILRDLSLEHSWVSEQIQICRPSDFLWIPELSQDKVDWYQLFFSRYLNIAKVFIVYEHFYLEKRFNGALEGWEKDERKVLSLTKTIELWIIRKKSFAVSDDPLWWPFLKSVTLLHFPHLETG